MKYNGQNIITTDDITVSGDLSNIGENITDILIQLDQKLKQLNGNVKWLAKNKGSGNGSGGGTTTTTTSLKFTINLSYTNLSGNLDSVKYTQGSTVEKNNIILVQPNTPVKALISITSTLSSAISYRVRLQYGTDDPIWATIDSLTGATSITFYPTVSKANCEFNIYGDTDVTIPFLCFTQLVSLSIKIKSGDTEYDNNSSIYSDAIDNLNFNVSVKSLVDSLFSVRLNTLSINGDIIDTSKISTPLVYNYSLKDYFSKFGIYTIYFSYDIVSISSDIIEETIASTYNLIYKDPNTVYIYCYTTENNLDVLESTEEDYSNIYSGRVIPVYYRIYGKLGDGLDTTYPVIINEELQTKAINIQTDISYSVRNRTTNTNAELYEIKFEISSLNYSKSYYIPIKQASAPTYIYHISDTDSTLCYGAIGATTDDSNFLTLKYVTFPSLFAKGNICKFTSTSTMVVNTDCIPTGYLNKSATTIGNYIKGIKNTGTPSYDMLINIGLNYLDKSYSTSIFTIYDCNETNYITFRRNEIQCGTNTASKKWAFPNDGDFHLITIYFKLVYYNYLNTESKLNTNLTFSVFIDGVQEFIPTEYTNFSLGPKMYVEFSEGQSTYNFLSVHTLNPFDALNCGTYNDLIKRYALDFDPILVSNFAMVYKNNYAEQNTTDQTTYYSGAFFDSSIYDNLCWRDSVEVGYNWINYYTPSKGQVTQNKFLPISAKNIYELILKDAGSNSETIPMYKIVPINSSDNINEGMHNFLYNTYTAYDENSTNVNASKEYVCTIWKYVNGAWTRLFDSEYTYYEGSADNKTAFETIKPQFTVKYQGSSSLLYSVKNFEIKVSSSILSTKNENYTYLVYYNLNLKSDDNTDGLWLYPESSFNFKADLVDSSSCTNNVIGNFVNDYMISPFNTSKEKYQCCLSGFPVLLFMDDNTDGSNTRDIFLGIYNINLNRSSVNNLGYLTLPDLSLNTYVGNDSISSISIRRSDSAPTFSKNFAVAEIQGNSGVYDFSQTDELLLRKMLGDYYVYNNGTISEEYSNQFREFFIKFSRYCYNNIIRNNDSLIFNLWDYNYSTLTDVRSNISSDAYYVHPETGDKVKISTNPADDTVGKVVEGSTIDTANLPYRAYENGVSKVGNPLYLFCILVNASNEIIKTATGDYYYYIIKLSSYSDDESNTLYVDLIESLKYYMVCMAFAMVDSVLKNLTIKKIGDVLYPEFYDMDTGLGLDNAGGNSEFKAFSDYVTSDGSIIADYELPGETGWFDTPSSLLFMYSKYDYLLNSNKEGYAHTSKKIGNTPYLQWATLRGLSTTYLNEDGYEYLKDANTFCDKYLYKYIGNKIPPLIWNLNYMYKYFSSTKSGDVSLTDSESKRFNGTMKYRRLDWLSNRFHYLDALFGIANTRNVGLSNTVSICEAANTTNNSDILICSLMFPAFTKRITGTFNVTVMDVPKTPIIFKLKTSLYKLFITDDTGKAELKNLQVTTNEDIGFLGTLNLTSVSECGLFLSYPDSNNEIVGSRLEAVKINSTLTQQVNLNLSDIPSVKTIQIGSLSSSTKTTFSKGVSINGEILGEKQVLTTFSIVGANYDDNTLDFSNIEFSIVNISNLKAGTLLFTNCTFKKALTINTDIDVLSIIFSGCTFNGNLTVSSTRALSSVTIKSSTASKKHIYINSASLLSITLDNITCSNLYINNPSLISNDNHTLTLSSLNLDAIILNKTVYDNGSSCLNTDITTIVLDTISPVNTTTGVVQLSLGGFLNLTEIKVTNCTYNEGAKNTIFELIKGGVAYASNLISLPTQISVFGTNISYAFLNCYNFNYGSLSSDYFTKCSIMQYTFALTLSYISTLTVLNVINILTHLKNTNNANYLDMKFMFLGRLFETEATLLDCIDVANAFPAASKTTDKNEDYVFGVFHDSGVYILVNEFKINRIINKSCKYFIGHLNSKMLILTGVLNDCEYITFNYLRGLGISSELKAAIAYNNNYHRAAMFFNIIKNTVIPITAINYSELFSSAKTLECDVYTTYTSITYNGATINEIYFDFGENGVGTNLTEYYGLFKYGQTNCNIRNLATAFTKNYDKITFAVDLIDTSRKLYTYISDNYKYFTNLYTFLVDESGEEPVLREKLLDMTFPSSTYSDGHIYFSFRKVITYKLFNTLITLLGARTDTDYLNGIFCNCTVIGESSDTEDTDYTKILQYKLFPFKYCIDSFKDFYIYNSKLEKLALDLDNIFKYKDEDVEMLGSPENCYGMFEYDYLLPLSEYNRSISLGSNNTISNLSFAFAYCTYNYSTITNPMALLSFSGTMSVVLPNDDYNFPILPDGFLNCVTDSCDLLYTFYYSDFATTNLHGYIPDNSSDLLSSTVSFNNTFTRCIFYWKLVSTTSDSIKNYRIYPTWYANFTGVNLFNQVIPMPLSTAYPSTSNSKCYLFYTKSTETLSLSSYLYTLPSLPGRSGSTTYYYNLLNMSSDTNRVNYIYGSNLNSNCLPASSDLLYTTIITERLIYALYVGEDIINDLNNVSGDFYINTVCNGADATKYFFQTRGWNDSIEAHINQTITTWT